MRSIYSRTRSLQTAASTTPEQVTIAVDRALMARESGYVAMAHEEISHALSLAEKFTWSDAAGDSRNALLNLAQVAAPLGAAQARSMLERYTSIGKAMDPLFAGRVEARVRAEEAYTHGLVLRAEGRLGASAERLHSAFATWNGIGYSWRAARAALELAELDAGDVFRLGATRVERPAELGLLGSCTTRRIARSAGHRVGRGGDASISARHVAHSFLLVVRLDRELPVQRRHRSAGVHHLEDDRNRGIARRERFECEVRSRIRIRLRRTRERRKDRDAR